MDDIKKPILHQIKAGQVLWGEIQEPCFSKADNGGPRRETTFLNKYLKEEREWATQEKREQGLQTGIVSAMTRWGQCWLNDVTRGLGGEVPKGGREASMGPPEGLGISDYGIYLKDINQCCKTLTNQMKDHWWVELKYLELGAPVNV